MPGGTLIQISHSPNEQEMLSELASETGAHYHSYSQSRGSKHYSVEDTEIDTVGAELSQ